MFRKIIPAATILMAFFSTTANASWSLGAGIENYTWQEFPVAGFMNPKETGKRHAVHLKWIQDVEKGILFGYQGKFYGGTVNYDTYTTTVSGVPSVTTYTPVSTETSYSGIAHEGQLIYRSDLASFKLDLLAGVGFDLWQRGNRNMNMDPDEEDNANRIQAEDYTILFWRAGINLGPSAKDKGLHIGGGLKYPFWTSEDAKLDRLGYYTNPSIKPGRDFSRYAELGTASTNTLILSSITIVGASQNPNQLR